MSIDLFEKVKELHLPVGKFALFGSAPLGVRNLRESRDIDIIVVEDIWQEYKSKGGWEYKITENGVEHIEKDDETIEMWHNWMPWYKDVAPFIQEAEMIDGLPFVKLAHVLEWKRLFGREKDINDVKLIEKFLIENDK